MSNRQIKEILEKTVGVAQNDWSQKLDDALWAYCTAFKTPIGMTPFTVIYGKTCHLPVELEYKSLWATKFLNYDLKSAAEKRLLDLELLDENRRDAYENAQIYKEKTKAFHDKKIIKKEFVRGNKVLLFNSRFKLFSEKLRTKWSGYYEVLEVRPYGSLILKGERDNFAVNGQRCKLYRVDEAPEEVIEITLCDPKWKKPPDISESKLWDEAKPSNGKTRMNEIVGNGVGTSKTSSSKDKGKGKMPHISEIDPGDKSNANPDDFSSF